MNYTCNETVLTHTADIHTYRTVHPSRAWRGLWILSPRKYFSVLHTTWLPLRCDRKYGTYVIFPITYSTRTLFCRTLTVRWPSTLYDENKLCESYLQKSSQKSALNVSLILANAKDNKKAVLSQRWPRDARYISRPWAVAEIWPFEIIQDGGGRHPKFIRIENSAIRSAVPVNPTL